MSTSYFLAAQPGCPGLPMSTVKLEQAGAWHIHQCQHCQHMARDSSSVCPYYCAVSHGTWRTHSGTQRTHLSVSPLCPHGELHMCVSDPPCVTVNCECKYHRYSSSSDICVSTFHLPELLFENENEGNSNCDISEHNGQIVN